jgi:hypothetical protein
MTNRREFLRIGLTGTMLLPLVAFSDSVIASPAHVPLYKAIFDKRFPASLMFADEMTRRGITVHGISGDVTSLWYHDLYFTWKDRPVQIVGLTTKESLFCLEILARDAGYRATKHKILADGLVQWSIGPR